MDQALGAYVKTADWKNEKHVPAITAPAAVESGKPFEVEIAVGKEIPHPNTVEHYIAWIALHFVPEGSPVSVELGRMDFSAHGPAVATAPTAKFLVQVASAGKLYATAYCNLHGLWSSSASVAVS